MIENILLCIVFGLFIIFSFTKGIEIGQKIKRDEKVESKGPINLFKEAKNNYEAKNKLDSQQQIDEINAYNIDIYDGTSSGQKDFKK